MARVYPAYSDQVPVRCSSRTDSCKCRMQRVGAIDMDPREIHAKAPVATGDATASRSIRGAPAAEVALSEIRQHLETGQIGVAKRVASDAARRHPAHAEIQAIHRTLNEGRSFARPGTGRDMRPEYEWFRNPPKRYRGRWVALIGDAVFGSSVTLEELQASLPSDLDQTPLAVQIPA